VFEAVLSFAQRVNGGPLGLPSFIENPFSFVKLPGGIAPPGSLVHPYLLAGLSLLGGVVLVVEARRIGRRSLLVAAAVAVCPVGFTYSRTAVLAAGLVLVALAIARFPAGVVALAIGMAVPAAMWSDGWATRAHTTIEARSADDLSNARGVLIEQSLDLVGDHPITGVGPGLYAENLRGRGIDPAATSGYHPVHNLPLLAAAEGGVAAGLAMLVLFAGAGLVALRRGPLTLAIYAAFLPFCLLDHFAYTFPQGNVMLGLWLAAVAGCGSIQPWKRARAAAPGR
jgi:O-antigen ligase